MHYSGPFDLIALLMSVVLTLQWALPVVLVLLVIAVFNRKRRLLCMRLALIVTILIFLGTEIGVHICNTTNSCPLDILPSLFFK